MLVLSACSGGPVAGEREPTESASGQSIYETRCAPCHGDGGAGDGPAAAGLDPKPRNFRDPDFWRGHSPAELRLVVKQGKPGTLMPPFEGALSETQIDAVVGYLETFRPGS